MFTIVQGPWVIDMIDIQLQAAVNEIGSDDVLHHIVFSAPAFEIFIPQVE